jgi:large repetitive protein
MIKKFHFIVRFVLFLIIPISTLAQPISEFQQFNGQYDFTAVGNTLNASPNPCGLMASSSAVLNLEPTQTLVSAHLYWAAPWVNAGGGDFNVTLNGTPVVASRDFFLTTNLSGNTLNFFGAYADVTAIVSATGNGTYTFSDLDVDMFATGTCNNATDFGGWAIYIIYEDPSLLQNQISLFDGFEFVSATNPSLNITLTGIEVASDELSKIGFLAWEGDAELANGESLIIEGILISDPPLNPANNAFNSTNSYTGSAESFNMDLDFYNLEGIITPGNNTIEINLTSNQDFVIVHNIITSVNSELPDATIVIDSVDLTCDSRNIDVNYTVFNINSTALLPANTPIAFYANGTLIGNSATLNNIPIGGSENNSTALTIPGGIPDSFTLTAVVDDDGTGTGVVNEINEDNNDFDIDVTLIENPIAFPVSTIIVCDLNDDGFATFFLPVAEIQLLGTQPDITVTYYETLAAAEAGPGSIINPDAYTNIDTPFQTIFVRLQNINGCFVTSSFLIEVRPVDFIPFDLEDFEYCIDSSSDLGYELDLTIQEDFIFGGGDSADYEVTYHLTQLDAAAGINAIVNPDAFQNTVNPQVFWVRIVNTVINCVEIGSFTIQLYLNPFVTAPDDMTPFELCDDELADGFTEFMLSNKISEITGGNPIASVSFHESEIDAEDGENPLPVFGYTNTSNPQTIYARVTDINNGCVVFTNFELIVNENPAPESPDPLEFCDPDNDGFGEFNLLLAAVDISGGDPFIEVNFFETETNAINNDFVLPFTYNNINPYLQTIFARATNLTTGCWAVVALDLIVLNSPQIEDPSPLVLCDYNNNDTATFDLTLSEPEIFANIADPSAFTINYYQTQADADNGTNAIADPTAHVNISNPQTIYIVVEDIDNGCQSQTTLQLQVVDLPAINFPFEQALCDVTNTGDEIEAFDLTAFIPQITGGNTGLIVSFHESHPEAQSGDNALASPYNNIENPQNLWIRVEDSSTGCVLSTFDMTVTLTVNPLPTPEEPEPLEDCDPDNGGFGEFDLDSAIGQIAGGEPDLVITFHETFIDADMDMFALSSPYFNIVQDQQTVYVRVENEITGCHTVVELLLIVHPTPEVPLDIPDLVICSPDQVDVGIEFDLTLQTAIIYGDQDPEFITLTFHETEVAALNGTPAIVTPEAYANTSNPQTIWVRLSIGDTGCEKVGSFELVVTTAPEIAQPEDLDPLELCDDEIIDGFTEFDLTVMIPDITLGAPEGMEVQFYESEEDAQNQNNQIDPDTAYTNIANPQIIWVRVYDADLDCDAYTRFTIRVLPNPNSNAPDPIELCDVDQNGEQEFDLTIRQAQIVGGEPGVFVYYYETLELAEEGDPTTAIPDPTSYVNIESPEQIIYVRVENELTGCYTIVELLIIVNPLPEMIITNYVNCELENDGTSVFDLTTKIAELIDNQEPGNYTVTFHEIEGDEQVPQNAIPPVQLPNYTNQSNPQTLWVYIENTDTGCFVTGSFDLIVIEGVTATLPFAPLEVCEDDLGSGEGTFDLTDLSEEILNGQTPPEYEITYHESEEDALAGINAITPPESYQSGGGIIWARVTRVDPDFGEECFEIIPIELQVNPLPIIADFLESYRLCVDADGNAIIEEFGMTSPPVIDTGLSTPDYFFIWEIDGQVQFGETQGSITATVGGVYTVTVIDAQTGCESQASTTVTVSSPPLIYSAQAATSAFAGVHAIEATAEGLGDYVFQLDDGPYQDVGFWDNVSPGTHIVTITDRNGCGSVEIEVTIIDYPLFFTPNNDGYHDTWNIVGISSIPTAKIYIFDRHGKLLKQISPVSSGWDGTFNGRAMPSSDYWFRVVYTEDESEKEFRGHFTLKR